jgi:hypothetical protein
MCANNAFELETLSQHQFLIIKLQNKRDAQHSEIKTNHLKIEMLQQILDKIDVSQYPPSNLCDQHGYSRKFHSNFVNRVPDLNKPLPEFR